MDQPEPDYPTPNEQRIMDLEGLLAKIESLAFNNVGAKSHADADLALVQIHAIANEA